MGTTVPTSSVAAGDPAADLALLTGPDAQGLLQAALHTSGEELVRWRVKQVDHRPGASTTVSYRAVVVGPSGHTEQVLAASTGLRDGRHGVGVLRLSDGDSEVAVWRYPLDPGLPALAAANDAAAVRALLTSCGVAPGPVKLRLRSYRPRRRAVIEVAAGDCRVFLKVLRPSKVADLHERHRLLRDAGVPVPRSLGWTEDGLLVLEGLSGVLLRERMRSRGRGPDGQQLLALLDRLPPALCALPHRRSWTDEVAYYAAVIGAALPGEASRCGQLAARISELTIGGADEAVHGDLYETQLLLAGSAITGLLDVDTAGPGRRADDLACLLAHANVLALMEPEHRVATYALGRRWLAVFEQAVDARDLRARVAGVAMSLATGPHRVQETDWPVATRSRLDLVERWVDSAEQV